MKPTFRVVHILVSPLCGAVLVVQACEPDDAIAKPREPGAWLITLDDCGGLRLPHKYQHPFLLIRYEDRLRNLVSLQKFARIEGRSNKLMEQL